MTTGLLSDLVQAHAQHLLSIAAGSTTDRRGEKHSLIKWSVKVMNGKLLPQKYAALNLHPANPPTHTQRDVLTSWYVLLSFYDSMHGLSCSNTTSSPFLSLMAWSLSSQQSAAAEHFAVHTSSKKWGKCLKYSTTLCCSFCHGTKSFEKLILLIILASFDATQV